MPTTSDLTPSPADAAFVASLPPPPAPRPEVTAQITFPGGAEEAFTVWTDLALSAELPFEADEGSRTVRLECRVGDYVGALMEEPGFEAQHRNCLTLEAQRRWEEQHRLIARRQPAPDSRQALLETTAHFLRAFGTPEHLEWCRSHAGASDVDGIALATSSVLVEFQYPAPGSAAAVAAQEARALLDASVADVDSPGKLAQTASAWTSLVLSDVHDAPQAVTFLGSADNLRVLRLGGYDTLYLEGLTPAEQPLVNQYLAGGTMSEKLSDKIAEFDDGCFGGQPLWRGVLSAARGAQMRVVGIESDQSEADGLNRLLEMNACAVQIMNNDPGRTGKFVALVGSDHAVLHTSDPEKAGLAQGFSPDLASLVRTAAPAATLRLYPKSLERLPPAERSRFTVRTHHSRPEREQKLHTARAAQEPRGPAP